jgi:PHD/YefM family antitoxin component YafN of YafNO toxin-antitoxin module
VRRYLDAALTGPVIITRNGRDRNVLISAAAFETLVRGRVARRMEDLDDETLKTIAAAEVPPHFASLDKIDLGDPG